MTGKTFRGFRAGTAALCSMASFAAAHASDGDAADGSGIEEVVVTARKRAESLQEVPLSITAVTGRELEKRGASDIDQFIASVPNVTFGYGAGAGRNNTRQIALRGIYASDTTTGNAPGTTGFYIGETPLEPSAPLKLVDVNRVEILRGPQGTLYGASSMGGTVKVVTNRPDASVTSYDLKTSVGSVEEGGIDRNVQGTFNLPLSDQAALRVTTYYDFEAGVFDRVYGGEYSFAGFGGLPIPDAAVPVVFPGLTPPLGASFSSIRGQTGEGREKDVDGTETYGAQFALGWQPTDSLNATAKLIYQRKTGNGAPYADQNTENYVQRRAFNIEETSSDELMLGALEFNYDTSWGSLFSSTSYYKRQTREREDISEAASSMALFNFVESEVLRPIATTIDYDVDYQAFTQELRATPRPFGPLELIGGVYYQERERSTGLQQVTPGLVARIHETPHDHLIEAIRPTLSDTFFLADYRMKTTEIAAFAELTYHMTEDLSGTVGARAYRVESDFERNGGGLFGPSAQTGEHAENGVNPKLGLKYKLDDRNMIYAVAAQGYRAAGVNSELSANFSADPVCQADLAARHLNLAQLGSFDSDRLWSYEIGGKHESSRGALSGAIYYIDWSDILQIVRSGACGDWTWVVNAGKARSVGAELEGVVRVTRNLNWSFGAGYTDATFQETSPESGARKGDRVQQVPEWTASTALDYEHPLTARLTGRLRSDVTYVGESFTSFDQNDPLAKRDGYTQLDVRLGVEAAIWEAALFISNATNERPSLGIGSSPGVNLSGRPRIYVNRPRTIGVNLSVHF